MAYTTMTKEQVERHIRRIAYKCAAIGFVAGQVAGYLIWGWR